MDEHKYDDNLNEILRISIRGIIFVEGKLTHLLHVALGFLVISLSVPIK